MRRLNFSGKVTLQDIVAHIEAPDIGGAYPVIGLERHSKVVVSWHVGKERRYVVFTDCSDRNQDYGSYYLNYALRGAPEEG